MGDKPPAPAGTHYFFKMAAKKAGKYQMILYESNMVVKSTFYLFLSWKRDKSYEV